MRYYNSPSISNIGVPLITFAAVFTANGPTISDKTHETDAEFSNSL